jgi:N-acetylglucosamine-6-phosphate deacetylase
VKTLVLRGRVVTEKEIWDRGTVLIEGGTIAAVGRGLLEADETLDMADSFLVPGFVDLQVNGAFGVDVVTHPGSLARLSAKLLLTGTTSYLPTIVSLPLERYPSLLSQISLDAGAGAEPLGLHLEGPFINPARRGAHPEENVSPPDVEALEAMLGAARVRMVTLAPEMAGNRELMEVAAGRGVVVSLGHSDADFEEALEALDSGVRSVTHLFNAMSPLHHRDPGLPGAVLVHAEAMCGIIADGRHVHPGMVRLAYEKLGADRLYLVTDAMAAAGMGPGEHILGDWRVRMSDGVPRLEDGTLAGSALRMDEALSNAIAFTGCALPEAVRMAATTPARVLGEDGRKGRLAPGRDADVVALSPALEVEAVWSAGDLKYDRRYRPARTADARGTQAP